MANELKGVFENLKHYKDQIVVIKIGGSVAANEDALKNVLEQLRLLAEYNIHPILVHGGKEQINGELKRMEEQDILDELSSLEEGSEDVLSLFKKLQTLAKTDGHFTSGGVRVTDGKSIKFVKSALGKVNDYICKLFNDAAESEGSVIRAVGHSGYNGRTVVAKPKGGDDGDYTGEVSKVNESRLLYHAKEPRAVLVLNPVSAHEDSQQDEIGVLNVNADEVAAEVAVALKVSRLIFVGDEAGILDKEKNIISNVSFGDITNLITDGTISRGMIKKALEAKDAAERLEDGSGVAIVSGIDKDDKGGYVGTIIQELIGGGGGTLITRYGKAPKPLV